ncbi:MAG: hypothetical protein ACE5IW_12445 [bacterium]
MNSLSISKERKRDMARKRSSSSWRTAVFFVGIAIFATLIFSLLLPARASVAVTVPYSTTPVADGDLDGDPSTGAWSDASSYAIPLENGAGPPYGTATLYVKHDGTYVYYRIDGSVDVAWVSAAVDHFWVGIVVSDSGTSHHGGGATWDGTFLGESNYSPEPTYPPTPVDTYGFGKPPAKDASQDALGAMQYSGPAAPFSFTAEWKKALNTGDADDIALVADGATTYNFFVTTDSNGKGSAGGTIDHNVMTNLNTMKIARAHIPGDTDLDGDVDLDDLYNVLIAYGMTIEDAMATYGVPPGTDIDGDGWIDLDDLYEVLWNYGA